MDEICYLYPKPEFTGGVTNASVYFCECDEFDKAVDAWIPLEEKLRPYEYKKITNLRAPELYIGTFKEENGKIVGDKGSERWIHCDVDICRYWRLYKASPQGKRRPYGSRGERSILTDMTPIPDCPAKRREADWGNWPHKRTYVAYVPDKTGKTSSMMTRYVEAAMDSGVSPVNINMRVNAVFDNTKQQH